jgi:PAS domain S-box-containing protein
MLPRPAHGHQDASIAEANLIPLSWANEMRMRTVELRESEVYLRTLARATSEGIVISQDGIIVDANEAFSKIVGCELKEILGQRITRFIDFADQHTVEENIKEGKEAWIEHRMVHKDGHVIIVETHGQTAEYRNQHLRFTAIRDVTEHKRIEDSLRENQERLLVTLASIGDAVITTDSTGHVTFLNPVAETATGWKADETIGKPVRSVFQTIDEETGAAAFDVVSRALEQRRVIELGDHPSLVTRDGRKVPIEDSASPILNKGRVIGAVLVFRDITDRRKAERVTFDANQRLKALLQALPVGVHFSRDISCQFIDGNMAAMAQFEGAEGDNISASAADNEVPGRKAKFFIGDRQITDSEMPIQRAITEDRVIGPFEMKFELPSGRKWLAEASAAPIHDQRGNVIGGVAVTADITDRKRVEEALRQSERLKSAEQERSKLSGRLIEAQEKERARIARELHDDICQQLAFLAIQLDQLRLKASSLTNIQPERACFESDRLAKLNGALNTCREIGKNVQTLSHDIHSSKLDYIGLVSAVRGFCKESSEKFRVKVMFSSKDVPESLSKEVSLCVFRIVQEALRNGIKHSGATSLSVSLQGECDGIELRVCDQGVGFDPEDARAKCGLGLVSIQERLNLLNGTFSIESRPSQGTTIRAWIPVVPIAVTE